MTIGTELNDKVFIKYLYEALLTQLEIEDVNLKKDIYKFLTEFFKNYVVYSYYEYEDI